MSMFISILMTLPRRKKNSHFQKPKNTVAMLKNMPSVI